MRNTTVAECLRRTWIAAATLVMVTSAAASPGEATGLAAVPPVPANNPAALAAHEHQSMTAEQTLSPKQQAIPPIAACMAIGNLPGLHTALNQGLDAGLTLSEVKEILVQLYAYAGFPRSLNALGELMKVLEERKQRGIRDAPGREPTHQALTGDALLAVGTANQTRVSGAPVKGPLFDFAPVIDRFLKTHLFGDVFERDNLDWQSRELATVGALAALPGLEPQLQSHMRASMNVGLTPAQLRQLIQVLAQHFDADAARRAREALDKQLAAPPAPRGS